MPRPLVVWRFTDGKPGHDNQSAGLLAALQSRTPLDPYNIDTRTARRGLSAYITAHDPLGTAVPAPDLLVGAGHATHLSMLGARRARGGRVVVLMKPSLPLSWFDLCLVPAHDRPCPAGNVLVTTGVLNRVRYDSDKDAARGLILVGGPSAHVDWQTDRVQHQVCEIARRAPGMHWSLATSRRTPEGFALSLGGAAPDNLDIVPHEQTTPDWLPAQLARAAQVWVTEDSVSMIYEALTAGAAVGLLPVHWRKSSNRLAQGIRSLRDDGLVTDYEAWHAGADLQHVATPFDEAGRCADRILERWPVES